MTNEEYNGWKNRETWLVHLWISNDESSYKAARYISDKAEPEAVAQSAMRELVEDVVSIGDDYTASLATDILNHAMTRVAWAEIVEAFR